MRRRNYRKSSYRKRGRKNYGRKRYSMRIKKRSPQQQIGYRM